MGLCEFQQQPHNDDDGYAAGEMVGSPADERSAACHGSQTAAQASNLKGVLSAYRWSDHHHHWLVILIIDTSALHCPTDF